jgi:hypothetical protein
MNTRTLISSLAFCFSLFPGFAFTCDRSSLALNGITPLAGGQYQIEMTFCVGSGRSATAYGADQNTGNFAFHLNGATVASFPATLTSPSTGNHYTGYLLTPDVLYYENIDTEWWACIESGCGAIQTVCKTVTIITQGRPESIALTGMEGGGYYLGGCLEPEMTISTGCSGVSVNAGTDRNLMFGYGTLNCTTLSASTSGSFGTCTYLWSNGSTSSSLNVCPVSSTNYTVTITDQSGCTATDAVSVGITNITCAPGKVSMCLNNNTICAKFNQVPHNLSRGATFGPCSGNKTNEELTSEILSEPVFEAFPNPFTGSATIHLMIPEGEHAVVELFDLSGKMVSVLFDGYAESFQDYEVQVNGSDLSAGVYFYRYTTDSGTTQTKKLVYNP